eukprot:TRINITY_DN890_c0_g1_i6.p2 TRINITY_DN890_c0_g1~~TRINITY_DN890_c0_g1_i6.p2  ORF type:complete len:151 (+),score=23.90 TRINITY_DN890_c0_g1_i6:83-535(+)
MVSSTARLNKELQRLKEGLPEGCSIDGDPTKQTWKIYLKGPKDSPYEGGTFKLDCQIPTEYPFKAPNCKFETSIYHPNVKQDTGQICDKFYRDNWSPLMFISEIVKILYSMLASPNLEDPLEIEIANEYKQNYASYFQKAKELTEKYAKS